MAEHLTEEQMSPDASPGEVSRRSGVRRVNNLPVYLVGGVMTVFLIVMVLVAADRAADLAGMAGQFLSFHLVLLLCSASCWWLRRLRPKKRAP